MEANLVSTSTSAADAISFSLLIYAFLRGLFKRRVVDVAIVVAAAATAVVFIQLFVARRDCVQLDRRTGQPQPKLALLVGNARATDALALDLAACCSRFSILGLRCSVLDSRLFGWRLFIFHCFAIATRKKLLLIKV